MQEFWLTIKQAIEFLKKEKELLYTGEHLALLCRSGFIKARKRGRDWEVDSDALKKFTPKKAMGSKPKCSVCRKGFTIRLPNGYDIHNCKRCGNITHSFCLNTAAKNICKKCARRA